MELRKKGPKGRRVYVQCVNKDKGAVARKNCAVACIGCGKCQKVCKFEAITIENNLSYIDYNKCRMCTKCVDECPTGAIVKVNFPVRKSTANIEKTESNIKEEEKA
jgi:ferredoxin